jgi:hypothetical protein
VTSKVAKVTVGHAFSREWGIFIAAGCPEECNEWFTLWVFSAVPVQELSNGEYLIAFDDAGGVAFNFGVSAAK